MRLHQTFVDVADLALHFSDPNCNILSNKTRQGYARKRILKPAGYFFVGPGL